MARLAPKHREMVPRSHLPIGVVDRALDIGHYAPGMDDPREPDLVPFLVELERPFDPARSIGADPHDLVRFALGASDYWAGLALDWLGGGLAVGPLADDLRRYSLDTSHPQALRHRAARLAR